MMSIACEHRGLWVPLSCTRAFCIEPRLIKPSEQPHLGHIIGRLGARGCVSGSMSVVDSAIRTRQPKRFLRNTSARPYTVDPDLSKVRDMVCDTLGGRETAIAAQHCGEPKQIRISHPGEPAICWLCEGTGGRSLAPESKQHIDGDYNVQASDGSAAILQVFHGAPSPAELAQTEREQARTWLERLPLDAIPAPAPLPAGSTTQRLPPVNHTFVGREDELRELARSLKSGVATSVGQIAAATGQGGIGKTQLASEFAHRYGHYFAGGVFWLSFADADSIPAEIAECGTPEALGLWPKRGQPAAR